MKADTIKVSGISKRFDSIIAVNAVSFSVGEGECFGLLGPNGAGKSTTIKMLTTLLQPDEGEITIDSYSIRRHPSRIRSIIGYVPQAVSATVR